jgi:hypothetical protein
VIVLPGDATALNAKLQVAIPVTFEIATAGQRTAPPVVSVNVTLPVGRTDPDDGFTVAVNVTVWFTDAVGKDDTTVTTGAVFPTDSVIVVWPATVKFGSPAYVAPMTSAGETSDAVVQVAAPPAVTFTGGQSPLDAPLMVKVTVPEGVVGVSATPVSWAVKVTEVPTGTEGPGAGVNVMVAASALTVWLIVAAVAVLKLLSPG